MILGAMGIQTLVTDALFSVRRADSQVRGAVRVAPSLAG